MNKEKNVFYSVMLRTMIYFVHTYKSPVTQLLSNYLTTIIFPPIMFPALYFPPLSFSTYLFHYLFPTILLSLSPTLTIIATLSSPHYICSTIFPYSLSYHQYLPPQIRILIIYRYTSKKIFSSSCIYFNGVNIIIR